MLPGARPAIRARTVRLCQCRPSAGTGGEGRPPARPRLSAPGLKAGLPSEDRGGQGREFVTRVQGSGAAPSCRQISARTGMLGSVTNMCWLCGLGVISARDDGHSDIDRFSTRTATGPERPGDAILHGVQQFVNRRPRAGKSPTGLSFTARCGTSAAMDDSVQVKPRSSHGL